VVALHKMGQGLASSPDDPRSALYKTLPKLPQAIWITQTRIANPIKCPIIAGGLVQSPLFSLRPPPKSMRDETSTLVGTETNGRNPVR